MLNKKEGLVGIKIRFFKKIFFEIIFDFFYYNKLRIFLYLVLLNNFGINNLFA